MQTRCPHCQKVVEGLEDGTCPRCGALMGAAPAPAHQTAPPALAPPLPDEVPERLGRYVLTDRLGAGGFAVVYRARDTELARVVAIKLLQRKFVGAADSLHAFLEEARILASLEHPGILPIYDIGHTEDGLYYLVTKLIEGSDLLTRLKQGKPTITETVEIVARVAEALHYAHQHSLIHRDVKPANILLDAAGHPLLVDFGLALREQDFGKGPTDVGTPLYMSPEQARREGHLVDAHTDVYSLGVVFYEMLTGRHPFRGTSIAKLLEFIRSGEAVPPCQIDPNIPAELERIWRKATARHTLERYATAQAFADDLRHWQAGTEASALSTTEAPLTAASAVAGLSAPATAGVPASKAASSQKSTTVVPRGLRAFSRRDADFFLDLLPGPRNRDGLPESIQFWKTRLESTDPEEAFRVGVVYGPSGCGKSSLLRAGLMPRLAENVVCLFVEASPDQTEERLREGFGKCGCGLPPDTGLVDALRAVRRGEALPPGHKLVLVIDQFEQWLSTPRQPGDNTLIEALRQCDGVHLQTVLLLRDEFWLAVSRFLRELDVRLADSYNITAVDLFDAQHARGVLSRYGQAFGKLPASPAEFTSDQQRFLDQAVNELAEAGKIIPVRLSLFTEIVKDKPWTPATMQQLGGVKGIGVAFLEETFSAESAPAAHRQHARAARAVLRSLLPPGGVNLKGHRRSREELYAASGYTQPEDFEDLLSILDAELRLITTAEDDRVARIETADSPPSLGPRSSRPHQVGYYQLTHDYLVPAVREWLARKQRETRRGRAEMRLAERSNWWSSQPEPRHLPGFVEWLSIGLLTERRSWTGPERALMRAATRRHLVHGALGLVFLLALAQGWGQLRRWQAAELAAMHADDQVTVLRDAPLRNVPEILAALQRDWPLAEPRLRAALARTDLHPRQQRNLRIALLPVDATQVTPLSDELLHAERPEEILILRDCLLPHGAELTAQYWRIVESPQSSPEMMLRAAGALVLFDPRSPNWSKVGDQVVSVLLERNPLALSQWLDVFRPLRQTLIPPLKHVFRSADDERSANLSALVLADFASDQPVLLTELVLQATPGQFPIIWRAFHKYGPEQIGRITDALDSPEDESASDEEAGEAFRRRAQAAVILLQLGQPERVWPLLRQRPDPSLRSWLIRLLAALGTDPQVLAGRWREESDANARIGLILSLGNSDPARLDEATRNALVKEWLELYRHDEDPGLHAAIDWTLRQRWQHEAELRRIDAELAGKPAGARRWFVNKHGQTFTLVPPKAELPDPDGKTRTMIPRAFAIGCKNVTVADFERFQQAHPEYRYPDFPKQYIMGPHSAMVWLSWFDAAAYCRWLSEQDGLPESEMCYPPLAQIKPGMKLPADYLSRKGYRLPTAAEWEYAARAGTTTPRFFGKGDALLAQYGWYADTAKAHVHPVGSLKPNALGMFDIYGNVWEWSNDRAWRPPAAEDREDDMPVDGQVARLVFGGCYADQAFALTSTTFVPRKPGECHVGYGLRLARTLK